MKTTKYFLAITYSIIWMLSACTSNEEIQRTKVNLGGSWQFVIDSLNTGENADWAKIGLPKNKVREVNVPHTWNVEKGLEKYWGTAWYERNFNINKKNLSKIHRLQFDAVYHDAIIFVNGHRAGSHLNSGYNRFFVDVSRYLKEGENRLTVKVNNSMNRSNIPFQNSFDWANDGGIYRNVYLVSTAVQGIENVQVSTSFKENNGTVKFKVDFISPEALSQGGISLKAVIKEENQKTTNIIFDDELKVKLQNDSFENLIAVEDIHLWHFDNPNLYNLTLSVFENGIKKDEYSTTFGFRHIEVNKDSYVLNGEEVRLVGVEWMPGSTLDRGMAENYSDFEKNLKLMKEANCIYTRFHWQQDEYVLDWCDRNGILVQEDIPYWGVNTPMSDTLLNNGLFQLHEMIQDHYNHPSIIAWGIGNELSSHQATTTAALQKLYTQAKTLDATRLVNYVSNQTHWGFPSENEMLPDVSSSFDMMMFNEYFSTWYGQSLDSVPNALERIKREYPHKPLTIAEWGICEPQFKGGDERRSSEMLQQIQMYGEAVGVAGAIYFCLNDYRTHMGEDFTYNYPQRVHGICDIHLNKKPSFQNLKSISAPIIIKDILVSSETTEVVLEGKKGIPSYTIRDYILRCGEQEIPIDELKPGEVKTFEFKNEAPYFTIHRPTSFEVLKYTLSNQTSNPQTLIQ
ncbi:glycoside hydrolase family 2 protein [Sediminitomix flava]|uniref:Beta-glucuronidase n=1 Tax=Sediminitomix flava TaxID=379075 RepID=A0A315YY33_SEDFL|nr:sugar-binding domain-containing protein [Sediminitomix flava]PWJ34967.1 beta-glucuronidase [Sediminitomix flava]